MNEENIICSKHKQKTKCSVEGCNNIRTGRSSKFNCPKCGVKRYRKFCKGKSCPRFKNNK